MSDDGAEIVHISGERDIQIPGAPVVSDVLVATLEDMLERARSGELAGAGIIERFSNGECSYRVAGFVGGYTMVGAAQALNFALCSFNDDAS